MYGLIVFKKFEVIEKELKTNKVILYSDTDIVYLKDIDSDVERFINSDYDIMFQDDERQEYSLNNTSETWGCSESNYICSGLVYIIKIKSNKKTRQYIRDAKKNMMIDYLKRKNNNEEIPHKYISSHNWHGGDQNFFIIALKDSGLKYGILDVKEYPNGSRYFDSKYGKKYRQNST